MLDSVASRRPSNTVLQGTTTSVAMLPRLLAAEDDGRWADVMEFFFSGEVDTLFAEFWRSTSRSVESRLTAAPVFATTAPRSAKDRDHPHDPAPGLAGGPPRTTVFQRKQAAVDYRTWIDSETETNERERLLTKNLVEATSDVTRKERAGFSGAARVVDVLHALGFTREDVERA
jgi:hypothetical protein